MKSTLAWIGLIVVLLAVLGLALGPAGRSRVCNRLGLCSEPDFVAAMLVAVHKEKRLRVLRASLSAPVTSVRDSTLGPVRVARTRQTVILPASVDYSVNLGALQADDLQWDAKTTTLSIQRPPVEADPPRIEWDKAQIYSDGNLMTLLTDVRERLYEDNHKRAPSLFQQQAQAAELMQMADTAADEAIATLFRMPLLAAGHTDPKVVVTH